MRRFTFIFILLSLYFNIGIGPNAEARTKQPIIGISAASPSSASQTYIKAVRRAGGVPLIIPFTSNEQELKAIVKRIDGIIMTGGEDVAPKRYGEEPRPELGEVSLERDDFDIKLIKAAASAKLPILGICRGVQVMNVAFGGSLYQDIPSQIPTSKVTHNGRSSRTRAHAIEIKEGTLLAELLGSRIEVNSTHHQAVKQLAPGFIVSATAEDGVVEAIESTNAKCIFGVQFHPEVFTAAGEDDFLGLFKYFIKACK